ncbi:MAG: hypothetical protein L0Y50_10070 [Beijerinckiaceae bacterium]|nr:hypothetical protein [Beijerinckiaceae bacterium]MCI0736601.1 hypothetical protein [Beijerinckiaceae bacterium]
MGGVRKTSFTKRAAVAAVALYALLLQGFLAASAPAASLAFPGGISALDCTLEGAGSGAPGKDAVRHHGLCCILACAAAACAYTGTASSALVFPAREGAKIDFAPVPGVTSRPPLKYFFAARGPPQGL